MQEVILSNLFPELAILQPNPLDLPTFASLPFFQLYTSMLSEKECRVRAEKSYKSFKMIRVKKGTVLYAADEISERGYILVSGCVEILNRKNTREKTQSFPGHIAHTPAERANYLHQKYKISKQKAETMAGIFYEQKIQFKYLPFRTIITQEEFGFGSLIRNASRSQTAIATDDSELLIIERGDFDLVLRDFQQKKENALINRLLMASVKKELAEEMFLKMIQIMSTASVIKLDSEDILYRENQYTQSLYFILDGELEIKKTETLEVPKKYLKNQNKGPLIKQISIRISKVGSLAFIGEDQIFSGKKKRNFTVACTLNGTLVLKIDHTLFLKAIGEFGNYEKDLISNAVHKRSLAEESFNRQMKKIKNSFFEQYEQYDSRKKEKMLSNFLNDFEEKNQMFQAFAPEGVFFRDTFQKLEGFDEAQKDPNKKQGIKRFKAKNNIKEQGSPIIKLTNPTASPALDKSKSFQKIDPTEKILFSPKKTMNPLQFFGEGIMEEKQDSKFEENSSFTVPVSPIKGEKSQGKKRQLSPMMKQYRSLGRFQQIQKDEAVYKRVLIKNGLYPKDKKIDHSKNAKALIHHNFDEVVKQCISRKNQSLKRVGKDHQKQIIVDTFHRTVKTLKNSSLANSQVLKFSRFTTPCRGTEQMKKKLQSIHHLHSGRLTDLSRNKKDGYSSAKIEECMGVNQKPKSSQIGHRMFESTHVGGQRGSVDKIVLLNHMMKPITYYNSTEL